MTNQRLLILLEDPVYMPNLSLHNTVTNLHAAYKCLSLTLTPKGTFSFNRWDSLEELPELLADCNCFSMDSIHFSCPSKRLTTLFNWPVSPFKTSARACSCNGLERCSPPALISWLLSLAGLADLEVRPADPGVCPGILLEAVEMFSWVMWLGRGQKHRKGFSTVGFYRGTIQLLRLLGSESNSHEFNMFISRSTCFRFRITRFTARAACLECAFKEFIRLVAVHT